MRKLILLFAAFAAVTSTAAIRTIELDGNSNIKEMLGNDTLTIDSLKVMGYLSHKNLEPVAWMTYYKLEYLDLSGCTFEGNTLPNKGLSPLPYRVNLSGTPGLYLSRLKNVIFPESLDVIGDFGLCCCSLLENLKLPSQMKAIGNSAFAELRSINGDFILPYGIETISNNTFANCKYINTLKIPETVKTIGIQSLAGMESLKLLDLPKGLEEIDALAFSGLLEVEEIIIPSSVKQIGDYAFCDTKMRKVIFDSDCKVDAIGENVFDNCTCLEGIQFSDNIESIGKSAFYNCTSLKEAYLPTNLQSIGQAAFLRNESLTKVVLGDKVKVIESAAFSVCNSLNEVYVKALTPPTITATTFENAVGKTLYVPLGAKSAYEAAPHWKEFGQIVEVSQFPSVGGVEAVLSDGGARVYGTGGAVVIDGDGVGFAVFTADGRLLLEGSADGRTEIPLTAGLYIVKTATGTATKVVVR